MKHYPLQPFQRQMKPCFSSKSSWTAETQQNDAMQRRLVEFLMSTRLLTYAVNGYVAIYGDDHPWCWSNTAFACCRQHHCTPCAETNLIVAGVWDNYHHTYVFANCICRMPSWTPATEPNGAGSRRFLKHTLPGHAGHLWHPDTQITKAT